VSLHIVSGSLRGRAFDAPPGSATRPTMDRTRAAIFDLVAARIDLDEALVLDVFAGSGALGFEALSRGAAAATFVDNSGPAIRTIQKNALRLGVDEACEILRKDGLRALATPYGPPYRLALADPPYDLPALPRLPDLALAHLEDGGLFVLEHDARHRFDDHPALSVSRRYGGTLVSVFARAEEREGR